MFKDRLDLICIDRKDTLDEDIEVIIIKISWMYSIKVFDHKMNWEVFLKQFFIVIDLAVSESK